MAPSRRRISTENEIVFFAGCLLLTYFDILMIYIWSITEVKNGIFIVGCVIVRFLISDLCCIKFRNVFLVAPSVAPAGTNRFWIINGLCTKENVQLTAFCRFMQ